MKKRTLTLAVLALLGVSTSLYAATPCEQPLHYTIGNLDPRFNLPRHELARYIRDASDLWNDAAGRTVLRESDAAELTINLVFDERQQNTIRKTNLIQNVELQKQDLGYLKNKISTLKMRHDAKVADFKSAQNSYNMRMSSYNSEVSYANSRGGADRSTYNSLNYKRMELDSEASRLRMKIDEIRDIERELKSVADEHNNIARHTNQTVNQINANAGEKFQEGYYDGNRKTITIYQYQSANDLKRVLAHELGHALRIGHVADKSAIMYYLNTHGRFQFTLADVEALGQACSKKK